MDILASNIPGMGGHGGPLALERTAHPHTGTHLDIAIDGDTQVEVIGLNQLIVKGLLSPQNNGKYPIDNGHVSVG